MVKIFDNMKAAEEFYSSTDMEGVISDILEKELGEYGTGNGAIYLERFIANDGRVALQIYDENKLTPDRGLDNEDFEKESGWILLDDLSYDDIPNYYYQYAVGMAGIENKDSDNHEEIYSDNLEDNKSLKTFLIEKIMEEYELHAWQ